MYHYKLKNGVHTISEEELCSVPLLQYERLKEIDCIRHCFTTRMGGVSEGIYASMNLSFTRGDREEAVRENFHRIANVFGLSESDFVFTDQTHTANVRIVTRKDAGKGLTCKRDYSDVDGLITNEPDLILSAFFADCVPLYFVDPVKKVIGLAHSGWRGTVGKIGRNMVEQMQAQFSCEKADIIAAIGPSICVDCYEVSEDVAEEFSKAFSGHEKEILFEKAGGKYQLDLWKANEIVLAEAGLLKEQILLPDRCTCCNHELLFSHRASNGKRGNLAAFLCLKQ